MSYALGFIGAGNMAEAIAAAAVRAGILAPAEMIASDPSQDRRDALARIGVDTTADNAEAVAQSRQVMLSVKPQVMAQAATDLAGHGSDGQVVISIMAGITTDRLAEAIGRPARVVRVMPNTPLQVMHGMAGVCLGRHAHPGDEKLAMDLLSAAGLAVLVDEAQMDAVTAVSGSGPAYVFYLAEAMAEAAAELGLTDQARVLVTQTLLGAATLLSQSPEATAADLRRRVTSPGGTTEAAINHLDQSGVRRHVIDAIKAAHRRGIELGR